ncbi:MAM and LDL-receptor class A domain-containing protein 1 [Neopsephotus bourkii]|uniref:MAM and LDL-receptor class A domain-containing protein 1 n=1 Tax=Neopsephotus bourkii TaxID=309878 RepID=UPI002AA587D9|nr:MAM and LDL-receptor class A domain-containing protein 1 [Neopsephotus bourkii]
MNRFIFFCALYCFALTDTQSSTGSECQRYNVSSAPSVELCVFNNQCGDSSDEKQSSSFKCDFESDLCKALRELNSQPGWIRRNGLSSVGPPYSDHSGNDSAYFLSLSSETRSSPATLRTNVFLPTNEEHFCQVTFHYWISQMNGTLMVGLQKHSEDTITNIWQVSGELQNQWKANTITINSTEKYEIIFWGMVETQRQDETVAIDDITFSEGCSLECALQTSSFKLNVCEWHSDQLAEPAVWAQLQAGHKIFSCSFPKDWSNNTEGHSEWLEANGKTLYKSAYLNNSMCHCFSKNCHFQFHYSMADNSVLKAVLFTNQEEHILWETNIMTKKEWVKVDIRLPTGTENLKLMFKGTFQSGAGFICLNNIQLLDTAPSEPPGFCSLEEFTCTDGQFTEPGSACDSHPDCSDGSDEDPAACSNYTICDFETDLCGWKPLSIGDADWNIMKEQDPLDRRLPGRDCTTNTGCGAFVYFSGSYQMNTKMAMSHLGSPFLVRRSPGLSCCQVRFWYWLSQDSQLSVFKRTALDGSLEKLHDILGLPEMQWTKVNIPVESAATDLPFQIVLRATILTTNATVAVDDISITEECGVVSKSLSGVSQESEGQTEFAGANSSSFYCPLGLFSCGDGQCISSEKCCDFTPDCSNSHDEANCPAVCDFERESCGWIETASADGFDWVRSSTSALAPAFQKQAPLRDHTYDKPEGHFMFILKTTSSISQIAQLRSPKFRQTGSNCTLSFWYYNYGHSVGAAEMQLLVDGLKQPTVLWRSYYSEGDQWLKAVIQLGRLPHPFQFSLDKISLGFYEGVSAIDDITFENCALPPPALSCEGPNHFWCRDTKACIDSLLVCDLVDNCGDGSDEDSCNPDLQCDFENGLCNWEQDVEDDFDWIRIQGPTPTVNTGPLKDYTTGTVWGHYLYMESSDPRQFKDKAVLLSPLFNPSANGTCIFRFHYHMFGKQVYKLSVFQRTVSNTGGWLLWYKFGNQGNRWIRQTLYISSSKPFQILVKGTVGDGFTGDIGLDDMSFLGCTLYNGNLPTVSTATPGTSVPATLPMNNCTEKDFVCRVSGHCIQMIQKCDFRPDCSDKSDESACVMEVCNFEDKNQCGWYQPTLEQTPGSNSIHTTNIFKWELGRGTDLYPGQEKHCPLIDHTTCTEEGWYLFADSSNGEFGDKADIATPVISLTGPKCKIIFWNHMNGPTIGSLEVLCKTSNRTSKLWTQSGSQGPQWNRAEVFLGIRSNFQIAFRANHGVSYMGDVAVDDITFEDCSPLLIPGRLCTSEEFTCANKYCIPKDNLCDFVNDCADNSDESPTICSTSIGNCNFEFDLCGWKQDESDDFDWNLRTSSTTKMGTEPATDHTLQEPSGHYIFIKSSFFQLSGQKARISSPVLSRRNKNCKILFYYHMYGAHIGSLIVYQRTVAKHEKILLNLTGNQGNFWQSKTLILAGDEDFQVVFEGIAGTGPKDGIALDDITFSRECLPSQEFLPAQPTALPPTGSCSHGYLQCQNGKCYRPEQSCDFEDNCGDNTDESECGTSCTFENGRCGWQNSLADSFNWVLGVGSSQNLRPPRDHTFGNRTGQFLYLEATAVGLKNEKAHVKSSRWKESSGTCVMSFWYFKSPKAMGHIQVLIKTDDGLVKIWSESGNHGDEWSKVELHLGKLRNFEVIFEGIRTRDLGGGVAIDDIEFTNCSTTGENPRECPALTDFLCGNKDCIESQFICDYKPDCEDLSDEADCSYYTSIPGSCNFETQDQEWTTACGLTQDPRDDFDWNISNSAIMGQTGPDTDHTPGRGQQFLYINSSAQKEGSIARIITTKPFPASLGVCRIRFWFWMFPSRQTGVLKVRLHSTATEHGMDILMWSSSRNEENKWMYANVPLSSNIPFRVVFEAEVGWSQPTEFALDDISFTPECVDGGSADPHPPTCKSDQFTCAYVQQCLPFAAKCNGTEDCMDGSDEMYCPIEMPTTSSPGSCNQTEFLCPSKGCIPSLLKCDGVSDCYLNEDEVGCPIKDCFNGSLLCASTSQCIPISQRCDGIVDCIDFSPDESSCSACPEEYCKNGGKCIIKDDIPLCQCEKEWKGNRCHKSAKPLQPPTSSFLQNDIWIGLGIGFLLIKITAAALYFFKKKKMPEMKLKEITNASFANPLYEDLSSSGKVRSPGYATSPALQISVSPWHEYPFNGDLNANSFPNPLYGEESEDVEKLCSSVKTDIKHDQYCL